jgi:uncharacterized SAM-binding protein YcdF (DUF218 family)
VKKRSVRAFTALVVVLAMMSPFLWFYREAFLNWPAKILVSRDILDQKVPLMILMMGGPYPRTSHAAGLYKKGMVGKILFAEAEMNAIQDLGLGLSSGAMTDQLLEYFKVPKKDRHFLAHTRNTSSFEEAEVLLKEVNMRYPHIRKILLVTSWYHSSRAKWIFEKVNTYGFKIKSFPTFRPKSWWKDESSFLSVFNEYLKWIYYLIRY